MDSNSKTARTAGFLYLIVIVTGIVSLVYRAALTTEQLHADPRLRTVLGAVAAAVRLSSSRASCQKYSASC